MVQCGVPWLMAMAVAAGIVTGGQTGPPLSEADGRAMEAAFKQILLNAATEHTTSTPRTVTIAQRSLNGWFRFQGADALPAGVADPELEFEGERRLIARATVDLDGLRAQQPNRDLFDPLRYLQGRLPVSAVGLVQAADGTIRVDFESVEIGSVPVPATLVHELVRYYTRSDTHPRWHRPDGILPPAV